MRYTYTPGGRLQSITHPSGLRVDYARNALGQTTAVQVNPDGGSVQTLLSNVTWYPFGPAAELTYGDGQSLKRSLDQNYRPGFVEDIAPGGLSLGYQFDAVGNLVTLRHGDQSEPPLRRYGYDALNRLTEVRDGATDALLQGYTYDATGNRTSATIGGTVIPYTIDADSHRLREVGNTVRWYDATGNTVSIGGEAREFVYNAAGRMRTAKRNDVPVMRYDYNGKGEQVRRYPSETSTAQTYAIYDAAGRVLGRYGAAGERMQEYIWLDDLPVGVFAYEQLYYVQADHLGTPRTVIDPTRQTAVWTWPLIGEVFGDTSPNHDVDGDGTTFVFDLRFAGQQYDAASGLSYNYFRNLDPESGRYVESDPIGLIAGMATYSYVQANPLLFSDALGLINDNDLLSPEEVSRGLRRRRQQQLAMDQLVKTYQEMLNKNVRGTDQFFHCLAGCRAGKASGNPRLVIELMQRKEARDYVLNVFGQYGDRRLSHDQMMADIERDMAVNAQGAMCPPNVDCLQRCSYLLDSLPLRRRPFMIEYRPDWR